MTLSRRSHLLPLSVLLFCLALSPAIAQNGGLKLLKNPGGSEVVYGPVSNQTTPQGAMAAVLHTVHTQLGDRPQVGKVFQSRDGNMFGAFFTLIARTQGNRPTAGLVIVSMANGAPPAAAVLFDDSSRFAKTEPILMRMLAHAWETSASQAASVSSGNGSSRGGAVPPLTPTRFPDGSGAVSLPAGWTIPFSSHGAAKIVGPRGETVLLGNSFGPIYDPSNPRVQAQMRYANPNIRPNYFLCPEGDALRTYECLLEQNAAHGAPSFQLKKSQPIAPYNLAPQGGVLIDANLDQHDGRGMMTCQLGLTLTGNAMSRTLHLNGTCAPQSSAAQEQPTLKAIFDSYTLDANVIGREYAGDEARSRQAGANARIQANNAHAAEDAQASAFNAHMDNIDRMSKSFQNYQLDNTELQDNSNGARGAVPNDLANALIKADPDRFQSVATPDFLKGKDF